MTREHGERVKSVLDELMRSNRFTEDTRFYRFTPPEFLTEAGAPGQYRLSANDDPSEAVSDVYEQGHITTAQQIGPGLAFAQSVDNEWNETGRVEVEVRLKDVLEQGGRIYPVESVIIEPVWYMTLPMGEVLVREVQ